MRFPLLVTSLSLSTVAIACSSDSASPSKQGSQNVDGGSGGGSANGGSSSGGKGGSSSGTGGTNAGGAKPETGGADPADCEIDSGTDVCRLCLASHCCDDFKSCAADTDCQTAFDTYQTCVHDANGDANVVSQCYSTFAGAVAGKHAALATCAYGCSKDCGGPETL
jgi:hypothetical protein